MLAFLTQLGSDPAIRSVFLLPAFLILVDLLTGVLAAWRRHRLDISYLPNFMGEHVVPIGSTIALAIAVGLAMRVPLAELALANHALLVTFYLAQLDSIVTNGYELVTGQATFGMTGANIVWAALRALFSQEMRDVPPPSDPGATAPAATIAAASATPTAA